MTDLDAVTDRDEECMGASCLVSSECAARARVIPAGEPHNLWLGVRHDDGRPYRRCVHCVRQSSWGRYRDKQIATRVTIEYSDGEIVELDGEAAMDYIDSVAGASVVAAVHGANFQPLPWKKRRR